MKNCTKCGRSLPTSEFHSDKRKKDGLRPACKNCHRQSVAAWRSRNARKETRRKKSWSDKHREQVRAKDRRYQKQNRTKIQAWQNKWKAEHPDKAKAHRAVQHALRIGTLIRPQACRLCDDRTRRLHAHHEDYTKPLEVVWMCARCHREHHLAIAS